MNFIKIDFFIFKNKKEMTEIKKTKVNNFKLLLIGEGGTGKTSFIEKHMNNFDFCKPRKFNFNNKSFYFNNINNKGVKLKTNFNIFEECDIKKYTDCKEFLDTFDCYILFCDITDLKSYVSLLHLINIIKNYKKKPFVIIANKTDLLEENNKQIYKLSKIIDQDLFDNVVLISNKTSYNINEPFVYLLRQIYNKNDF